jgi:hypothetical protein
VDLSAGGSPAPHSATPPGKQDRPHHWHRQQHLNNLKNVSLELLLRDVDPLHVIILHV